jgi:hypothetical protein
MAAATLDNVATLPKFPKLASTAGNGTYVVRSTNEEPVEFSNDNGDYQFSTWFTTPVCYTPPRQALAEANPQQALTPRTITRLHSMQLFSESYDQGEAATSDKTAANWA